VNHHYFLVLSDLTKKHRIPLVLYDQIGCANSTHLPDKMGDRDFWTPEIFVRELENLLTHLGIQNDYDIVGHSWGTMFGSLFAVRRPPGLRRLVLMSAVPSVDLWEEAAKKLRAKLPKEVQDVLDKHEKEGTTDSQEYKDAVFVYYEHYMCTLKPIPEEIMSGFEEIEKDPTVYLTM
jgi:proline-specific peptidase